MAEQREDVIIVGITGASGSLYGIRLIKALLECGKQVKVLLTDAGRQVMKHEMNLDWADDGQEATRQIQEYFSSIAIACLDLNDIGAAIASGSAAPGALVIAPCSMGTAGRIAAGLSGNLLERTADVMLKEKRPLVLVPRETPLNAIHLENLLRLSRAGATILPAMPAFYHAPEHVDELVDFVAGKVLDQLGFPHQLFRRWDGA